MYLSVCADRDCPNLKRIEELEREVAKLRSEIHAKEFSNRCPVYVEGCRCLLSDDHEGKHIVSWY
jgi:hypothetical protein